MPEISASAIPLIIGVAGHREILPEAREKLEEEVRGILRKFREDYPSTPLVILSALAYGADRLVVREGMKMNIPFYVPLPWSLDSSELPLPHGGGKDGDEELRKLIRDAAGTIVMPRPEEGTVSNLEAHLWEMAGAFVARHCQVLVALWDGDERDTGTRRVIRWQWEGHQAPYSASLGPLDRPEGGPVFHVSTPRNETSSPLVRLKKRYQKDSSDATKERDAKFHFEAIWANFERYNQGLRHLTKEAVERSARDLIPEDGLLTASERLLLDRFSHADATARYKQSCTGNVLKSLFFLALLAFLSVELYAHLCHRTWQLSAYIALLLIAAVVYRWSARSCHQESYLDCRALAEAIRVSLFWSIAGLDDTTADHYLRQFRSELDWIRQAARNCSLLARLKSNSTPSLDAARLDLIQSCWIEDQRGFFAKRKVSKHHQHERFETAQFALFWVGLAVAGVALATHICRGKEDHLLLVIMFGAAVLAAMVTEWNEKMGYGVDARRYEAAHVVFESAHDKMVRKPGTAEVQAIVRDLGVEALSENADWVIQHRHRPIGMPNI